MSEILKRIHMVHDHKPIDEKALERAIEVASVIQGVRVGWGRKSQYDPLYVDTVWHEMKAIVDGKIFPAYPTAQLIHQVAINAEPGELPIPRTDELFAMYDWFTQKYKTPYDNPMYLRLSGKTAEDKIKEKRRINSIVRKKTIAYKKETTRRLKEIGLYKEAVKRGFFDK